MHLARKQQTLHYYQLRREEGEGPNFQKIKEFLAFQIDHLPAEIKDQTSIVIK